MTTSLSGLVVRSGQGAYAVDFAASIETARAAIAAATHVFIDDRVAGLYPSLLAEIDPSRVLRAPATEEEKTLAGVERLARFLQASNASKRSTLAIVGGGIMQDIGAFAAHVYHRGIPYVLVPTTLLSMADSCIGAKTGINLGAFKNQLGFFQSPSRVVIWSDFVRTLAPDDLRSGYGEILKLAIIDGEEAFTWLRASVERRGLAVDGVDQAIHRSLGTKQRIIEEDEYERGLRKILNYGHTFGHALEAVTDHEVPHGLAVAWGVDLANYVAMRKGLLDATTFEEIHRFVAAPYRLEVRHPVNAAALVGMMRRDKKATEHSVQLVLLEALGKPRLVSTAIASLEPLTAEYLREVSVFTFAA